MINNNAILQPEEELNIVIDPGAWTHQRTYEKLIQAHYNHEKDKNYPFSDNFLQLYFENPNNKCILIRGCDDEYRNNNRKIELITENKFVNARNLHGKHTYLEIYNIISQQAATLGIDLNRIKRINIFDISHTDPKTNHLSVGIIEEKVDALRALNELCPNCKHTKIASTACWGGKKSPVGEDLITEVQKSIDTNYDWHKNNIVEIDITPNNDNNTQIRLGKDGKPHISYCLDKDMYEKKQLPSKFTREIYLLAKGKQNVLQQTHTFQNDQYRVTEGEGGFRELSINQIRQIMFPKYNQQFFYPKVVNHVIFKPQPQPVQTNQYQPIQQQYILQNYKPQNPQPIIQKELFIKKYSPPVNNVQYIVNQRPVVKNVIIPLQQNITTPLIRQPIQQITTQIQRPVHVINNVSPRNNNYQYNLPPKTINNYYNNDNVRSFNSEAEYWAWLETPDYINWITCPIKNRYPEYRNSTFSFQPLI